jgi:signal transduction histidine kinase
VRRTGWIAPAVAGVAGVSWLVSYLLDVRTTGLVDGLTTLLPVPIAFACGLTSRRIVGLAACVWLAVIGELGAESPGHGGFNPFIVVIIFGPWLAGAVVRERQQVASRLAQVGRELEAESQLLAGEAVRLERSRIARELHDIVAHCVSVMVVQAYAGEKLIATDDTSASEALAHITTAADQARHEIAHLVALLDGTTRSVHQVDLAAALTDLATGARATGLDVRLQVSGNPELVSPDASFVAYRVVQEAVTNALKHAPGAPIVIAVECSSEVTVDVLNGTGQAQPSTLAGGGGPGLAGIGGGHGLAGLRNRVTGLGGSFQCGPEPADSWRVSVRIPSG